MNRTGKLHALLSTARLANLPSVASNVWLGVAVGVIICPLNFDDLHAAGVWVAFPLLMTAGVFLYVSGSFFNDWMDRRWDARHRPERALPRGLFHPATYLVSAVVLAAGGVALAACVNASAAVIASLIVACVLIYTVWHKRTPWAVIFMGMCRALLPVMGFAGVCDCTANASDGMILAVVIAMISLGHLFYIIGLSLSARFESVDAPPDGVWNFSRCLFVLPPAMIFVPFFLGYGDWMLWIGIAPYALWMAVCDRVRRRAVIRYVSFLLAGLPLVDWIFLLPVWLWVVAGFGGFHPFGMACLVIPPAAFVMALLLQRLAPAT